MIVFQIKCAAGHEFEAWFQSGAAYHEQREAGTVVCPFCGATDVDKAPMAPKIAKSKSKSKAGGAGAKVPVAQAKGKAGEMLKAMAELRRQVEANCDYVGPEFAEEARKIHYGEADQHNIYGEASDQEAKELNDEGIDFQRIPWPVKPDS